MTEKEIKLTSLQRKSMQLEIIQTALKYPEFNKIALQRVEESRVGQIKELEVIQKESVLTREQQKKLEELIMLGQRLKEEQNANEIVLEEKTKNQNQK